LEGKRNIYKKHFGGERMAKCLRRGFLSPWWGHTDAYLRLSFSVLDDRFFVIVADIGVRICRID
jgi:hypothetical protein